MKKERVNRPVLIDNRYKSLKKLGAGSMGDVFKVRDLRDKEIIALKMLSREKTSSELVQRFKREFKLLTGLHHPNLCSVYDFGMLKDGRSYFTMEYIDGKDIYKASKGLSYKEIYSWIVQLCRALEYIHSKGLIHYDIKPGNVLVAEGEERGAKSNRKHYAQSPMPCVKLMDFGLAGEQRISGGILIKGTLPYIAPEVIKGLAIDHRADLYSLGVLLYEVFARRAFREEERDSFVTLLRQRERSGSGSASKVSSKVPSKLEDMILRLLANESSERYSRANEVIKEINRFTHFRFPLETEKTIEGYLLSSRFVGREKEMDLLKSLYERSQRGEGKVVVITGDAGVGKSRLLKEFKIYTQMERSSTFMGYAHKDKIVPLEVFHNIFSELIKHIDGINKSQFKKIKLSLAVLFRIFPDLTNGHLKKNLPKLVPLEPKQEKLRNFDALTELIRHTASELGDLVILLEDLHWADDSSIQFLEYLGRNLENRNIFICGTCKKEELTQNVAIRRAVARLKKESYFTQIEVRSFNFRSLYSFLDSTITSGSNSSKLVKYLMKKTGGNPFFVEEIMRTFLRKKGVNIGEKIEIEDLKYISLPETVEDVVLKRLKDLDSGSREVIKYGAILLKEFNYDLIKHLTGFDDAELSNALWKLKRRQVLVEEDTKYRLYHATLYEVVNKRLSNRERKELNYRTGKALERINHGRIEKVVEDLAYYFINAKDHKKGIQYGLQAARKSSERYAYEQTIRFYKDVIDLLGDKNSKFRFDVLRELADIEAHADFYDDALKHYNKAISLRTGAINSRVKIYLGIGDVYAKKGEYKKALHIYQKAARFIEKMEPHSLKVILRTYTDVRICRAYQIMGDYKSANKYNFNDLKFPKEVLKERKAITLLTDIYTNLCAIEIQKGIHSEINYDKVICYYKEVCKYSREIKSEDKIAMVLNNLGICYYYKHNYKKAVDCYQTSIKISEKMGDQYGVSLKLLNLGIILKIKGKYSNAIDIFQRVLSIAKKIGNPSMIGGALLGLGTCFLELCDYGKAKENYVKALKIFGTIGWKREMGFMIRGIGNVYKAMGDYTQALRSYRKALKIFRDIGHQRKIADTYVNISSAFIEMGQFVKAEKYIVDALNITDALELGDIDVDCYINLCRISLITRDYAAANDYYKKGMRIAGELKIKLQLLQLLLLVSEIYYHSKKYLKGIKIANKLIKLAKEIGIKDLHVEALLIKVKNKTDQGALSKIEVFNILDEAKRIAEEISCPEVLWKVYFEYGRLLQDEEDYGKSLSYYKRCNEIFERVGTKIENEANRMSYVKRPDRQLIFTATNQIGKLLS